MDIFEMLDELEEIIETGSKIPLTGIVVVDAEELLDCLDQIRSVLPEEIRQARWVAKERERMLSEAEKEAQLILEKAKERVEQLADESEIARVAKEKAEEIINKAQDLGMEIREGSNIYADQLLDQLEKSLDKALASIREGREELHGMKNRSAG
ncbi:MAG: ATPase [Clostridia bacterium]|nr:ATPase [Clostridia bacterium]